MLLDYFNKYLLEHPDIAVEFAKHKLQTKEKFLYDIDNYKNSISNFINGVLNCASNKETLITGKQLIIRKACIDDSHFINEVEQQEDNSPWIGNWPLGLRIEKFGDNDFLQTIIETRNGKSVGFIIFRDMLSCEKHIELKRIAIIDKGKGFGKEALYLSQKLMFEEFQVQRIYLSTKKENIRAQSIYKKTGFTMDMPDPCTRFHVDKIDYFLTNHL